MIRGVGVNQGDGNMHVLNHNGVEVKIDRECWLENASEIEAILTGRHGYGSLGVKGRVVIDIGAGCGDTPILYVLSGAKIVYALEPNPKMYDALARTIDANNLLGKVVPLLMALSDHDDVIYVDESRYGYWYEEFYSKGEGGRKVELVSYETMLYILYHNTDEYVLKIDCEGCERYLLGKDLSVFKEVLIEYHGEHIGQAFEKQLVEQGFTITYYDIFGGRWVGLIHGVRKQ